MKQQKNIFEYDDFGNMTHENMRGSGSGDKLTGSDVKNTSTVVKQFVVDYTVETLDPLMEHEVT